MSSTSIYTYKLRPGYFSQELLIEFDVPDSSDELQNELFSVFETSGFKHEKSDSDLINDELLYHFSSTKGTLLLSRNTAWDFFFLSSDDSESCMLEVDKILTSRQNFKKVEVDSRKNT